MINLLIYMKTIIKSWLFYNIKVIEDTEKHHEEFRNVSLSKVLFVIMMQTEFFPLNYPLSPPYPVNFPCQMPFYEFKNYLRNKKFFLQKEVFIQVLNFAIYKNLIFVTVQQSGIPSALQRLWEIAFNFVNKISCFLIGWFQL